MSANGTLIVGPESAPAGYHERSHRESETVDPPGVPAVGGSGQSDSRDPALRHSVAPPRQAAVAVETTVRSPGLQPRRRLQTPARAEHDARLRQAAVTDPDASLSRPREGGNDPAPIADDLGPSAAASGGRRPDDRIRHSPGADADGRSGDFPPLRSGAAWGAGPNRCHRARADCGDQVLRSARTARPGHAGATSSRCSCAGMSADGGRVAPCVPAAAPHGGAAMSNRASRRRRSRSVVLLSGRSALAASCVPANAELDQVGATGGGDHVAGVRGIRAAEERRRANPGARPLGKAVVRPRSTRTGPTGT